MKTGINNCFLLSGRHKYLFLECMRPALTGGMFQVLTFVLSTIYTSQNLVKMKMIIQPLLFAIVLAAAACQSDAGSKDVKSNNYQDTVQLNTVLANIANYAKYCKSRPFHTPINSYEIQATDLFEILNFPSAMTDGSLSGIRCYLGINVDSIIGNDTMGTTHLYLTPINTIGKDSILEDASGKKFLYDLTTPCPKTCDTSSQLYKAFESVWNPASEK
jgi:hypothetical protein